MYHIWSFIRGPHLRALRETRNSYQSRNFVSLNCGFVTYLAKVEDWAYTLFQEKKLMGFFEYHRFAGT